MKAEIRNTGEILEVKKITKDFIALFYKTPIKTLFDVEMEYCVLPRNKVILIP